MQLHIKDLKTSQQLASVTRGQVQFHTSTCSLHLKACSLPSPPVRLELLSSILKMRQLLAAVPDRRQYVDELFTTDANMFYKLGGLHQLVALPMNSVVQSADNEDLFRRWIRMCTTAHACTRSTCCASSKASCARSPGRWSSSETASTSPCLRSLSPSTSQGRDFFPSLSPAGHPSPLHLSAPPCYRPSPSRSDC